MMVEHIDTERLPLFGRFAGRIHLAQEHLIPVCKDIIQTSFQALHFDMGQPIVSDSTQTMQLLIGLYCPHETVSVSARTRVVSLRALLSQRSWGDREDLEQKLLAYVRAYGDGWHEPEPVNTFRLACFARVLDAVTGTTDMADQIDKTTGQWFRDLVHNDGNVGLETEYAFYRKRGLHVATVERQICVQPGQLLAIDNTRAVHGRIGRRKAREIYQYLYGVQSATPEDIDAFRESLISEFFHECAARNGRPGS